MQFLGTLGNTNWFKCTCGLEHHAPVGQPDPVCCQTDDDLGEFIKSFTEDDLRLDETGEFD